MDFIVGVLRKLRIWEKKPSDQQIKSVLFGLSATIFFKIAVKALATQSSALPEVNAVQIAQYPCLCDVIVVKL